jgi:hypothetical protein
MVGFMTGALCGHSSVAKEIDRWFTQRIGTSLGGIVQDVEHGDVCSDLHRIVYSVAGMLA